jgi:hypothetical protein
MSDYIEQVNHAYELAKGGYELFDHGKEAFSAGYHGVNSVNDIVHGKGKEAYDDVTETGSAAFGLGETLTKREALGQVGSTFSAAGDFGEAFKHFQRSRGQGEPEKGEKPDGRSVTDRKLDEQTLGVASTVDLVGDLADSAGGKEVKAVTTALSAGLKVSNKGLQTGREMELHGKNRDGTNRGVDDVVADKGLAMHDYVHTALGDGTVSDILSHGAGGAAMLSELPGAGLEAAGLGIYGYAKDAYNQASEVAGTAKKVVTNPTVQDWCAKMYLGLY